MSEIKRVTLNTLEPPKVSDKVIKKPCKTIRISVILPESNEDRCPEYNYKDQLASVKKKVKQNKGPVVNGVENGLDPFGDNDDDVRRIALEMEAKYGTGVTGPAKKKRKGKKDDYADIGMGYDESDSFIDNTDGYDEIIPHNVTTLHGGFYVNSGVLVFKTDDEASSPDFSSSSSSTSDSSSSESEGEEKLKAKKRKRILDSSGESDSEPNKEKKQKSNNIQHAIKKKLFSKDKIQVKKVDPLKKTVKDLLRAKREDLNMSVPESLLPVDDNVEKESSKENKKPMNISSVTDAIESVVKQVVKEKNVETSQDNQPVDVNSGKKIETSESTPTDSEVKLDGTKSKKEEEIKLPDNLPGDILNIITKLKEAAINYKGEGKKAFFSKEVNTLLLNLEKKSKSVLSKSSRVKVYEHLSQYIKCTKDTLIRRAKLLELEESEKRLVNLKSKLKDAVDSVMPNLIENYEIECQKVLQKRFSTENGGNNEESKTMKMPRRRFPWSDETKKLVKDILSLKKRCLTIEGKHKDNLEEQITRFLRSEVLPLWPDGWMYMNNLTKVYNSMQETSKKSTSSTNLPTQNASTKPQKHSNPNLSITPVTNGKPADKIEINNSITVTKVNTDIVKDNLKSSIKEKNSVVSDLAKNSKTEILSISKPDLSHSKKPDKVITIDLLSKPSDLSSKPSDLSMHESSGNIKKVTVDSSAKKTTDIFPNVQKIDSSSSNLRKSPTATDLTVGHSKKIDKPADLSQTKKNEMFKPYINDPQIIEIDEESNTPQPQPIPKQIEMFKPYADDKNSHSHQDKDKIKQEDSKQKHRNSDKEKHHHHHHHHHDRDKDRDKKHHSDRDRDKDKEKHKSNTAEKKPEEKCDNLPAKPKPTDLSKFQMFKPYSETTPTKSYQEDKQKSQDVAAKLTNYSHMDYWKYDVGTSKPKISEEGGVIVKNVKQINESVSKDDRKEVNTTKSYSHNPNHNDKVKGDSYKRSSLDLNYYSVANKHPVYQPTPLVNKYEGDGQQDIQMVMENLKALQRISCSPVKNENSSSSTVSVIAYNKNSTTKTVSNRNDANRGSEFSGGFQDEFQKQFINTLQQMTASPSANKSGYNNGS